jgi:hypothetical protein
MDAASELFFDVVVIHCLRCYIQVAGQQMDNTHKYEGSICAIITAVCARLCVL